MRHIFSRKLLVSYAHVKDIIYEAKNLNIFGRKILKQIKRFKFYVNISLYFIFKY